MRNTVYTSRQRAKFVDAEFGTCEAGAGSVCEGTGLVAARCDARLALMAAMRSFRFDERVVLSFKRLRVEAGPVDCLLVNLATPAVCSVRIEATGPLACPFCTGTADSSPLQDGATLEGRCVARVALLTTKRSLASRDTERGKAARGLREAYDDS